MVKVSIEEDEGVDPWYKDIVGRVPIPGDQGTPRLLVGSLSAAESEKLFRDFSITHVLTVASRLHVRIPRLIASVNKEQADKCANQEITHARIEIDDHPRANILEVLPSCVDFLDKAISPNLSCDNNCDYDRGDDLKGGNKLIPRNSACVLVHCASGISRSVTACAAYLMAKHGLTCDAALRSIRRYRSLANPNIGFRRQLEYLEEECGSDLNKAALKWSPQEASDIVDCARVQREVTNHLHEKVDTLELLVAKALSNHTLNDKKKTMSQNDENSKILSKLQSDLSLLQAELDNCLPSPGQGYSDPPARVIRKSASSKVERLLESISCLNLIPME